MKRSKLLVVSKEEKKERQSAKNELSEWALFLYEIYCQKKASEKIKQEVI